MTLWPLSTAIMRRIVIVGGALALAYLLIWPVLASESEPLRIMLSTPETCGVDAEANPVTPTLELGWEVRGGVAPYRVFVHGQHREQASGSALSLCGVWDNDNVQSGQMPILGNVIDASGASASALSFTQAVRVMRTDPLWGFEDVSLEAGQTYQVHGVLLTIPPDASGSFSLGEYLSQKCRPLDAECGDEIPLELGGSTLWIRRWHHDESRREIDEWHDADEINALFDDLITSIGKAPTAARASDGYSLVDSDGLTLELWAPSICETHWGSYGGRRQSIEVEWQVSGGRAPYQIQFADRALAITAADDHSGTMSLPCGRLRDDADGVDSQMMNTQAVVVDAKGATASGVVSTYVISAGSHGGDVLRGGWTHRMEGLLMTIPRGLEFDVDTIGVEEVNCDEGACTHSGCVDAGLPVCENSWTMGTLGDSVYVTFGYATREMTRTDVRAERLADDVGVTLLSEQEVEAGLRELAASVGEPPMLPEWGFYNSAPLRIWAWPDRITCGVHNRWVHLGATTAQRRVGGGAWWPLGVGDEAWNPDLRTARVQCGAEVGWHENTLEVHEIHPDDAVAETTVRHFRFPTFGDNEVLWVDGRGWYTSYCEPGGSRQIWWGVRGGVGPYHARVNGVEQEMEYDKELGFGEGWAMVRCANRLGIQAFTMEVWDKAEPPHRLTAPLLLVGVEEHPSGRPWSDFQ